MTAPDPHAVYDELAVGHAMGALEPADELSFQAHVHGCARCEQAVREHLDTLAHLAYAAEPVVTPPGLWAAIRASVEASDRPVAFPGAPVGEDPIMAGLGEQADDELAAARRRKAGRSAIGRRAAAITSIAAGFALVATLVVQNVTMREREQEQRAWTLGMERVLKTYGSDVRRVALRGEGNGEVPVVAVVDGQRVDLVVDELVANDRETSTYVLWERTAAGAVRAVGTFDVIGKHDVEVVPDFRLRDLDQLTALMVTRESGRTAPTATSQDPVAVGVLT